MAVVLDCIRLCRCTLKVSVGCITCGVLTFGTTCLQLNSQQTNTYINHAFVLLLLLLLREKRTSMAVSGSK